MRSSLQIKSKLIIKGLERIGVEFLPYLPCSTFSKVLNFFRHKKGVKMIPLSREEEGIGIMAGLEAGGKKAVLAIQDSGIGNALNACVSLASVYKIPILIIATRRGGFNEINEANAEMGEVVPNIIRGSRVMDFMLDYKVPVEEWSNVVVWAYKYAHLVQRPIILLINLKD